MATLARHDRLGLHSLARYGGGYLLALAHLCRRSCLHRLRALAHRRRWVDPLERAHDDRRRPRSGHAHVHRYRWSLVSFLPFYYFTLLAAAFRFGWHETLGLLVLTIFLAVFLYLVAPVESPGLSALAIGIFYLAFSAALGVLLARWAQENLDLALDRARALSFARDRARSLLRRLIRTQEEEESDRRAIFTTA